MSKLKVGKGQEAGRGLAGCTMDKGENEDGQGYTGERGKGEQLLVTDDMR